MLDSGMVAEDVAFENRTNKSLVSKWKKSRKDIIDGAATQHWNLLKKNRRSKKHDALIAKSIKRFRAAREKGRMVSFAWIYTHNIERIES